MEEWDENSEKVSKITPNKEKAKALLKLVSLREKDLETKNEEFATLIIEGYYEQIKELITAVMSIDGYKTISHGLLVGYVSKHYKEFSESEIRLIDQLRKTRNDIDYRGVMIRPEYLKRNKKEILRTIDKLKNFTIKKLK